VICRPMRANRKGQPVVARERWGLGVRIDGPNRDVQVAGGTVGPLDGGMSVALDWQNLLEGFIPRELGGTNRKDTMFSLAEEVVPDGLNLRRSGQRKGHYVLEPRHRMPIQVYEALLAGTQGLWEKVAP
jgi:hypothetical protein